jgi:hypothetical protein
MQISESDIAKRYEHMTDEEFAQLRRQDLTEAARNVYDRERERRGIPLPAAQPPTGPLVKEKQTDPAGQFCRSGLTLEPRRIYILIGSLALAILFVSVVLSWRPPP